MKRTEVAREASDQLKETEAAIDAALASARATLNRLVAAKSELGLSGTMGDRSIARMREVVAALEEAGTVAPREPRGSLRGLQGCRLQGRGRHPLDLPGSFRRRRPAQRRLRQL
jgi:hypothetical protein